MQWFVTVVVNAVLCNFPDEEPIFIYEYVEIKPLLSLFWFSYTLHILCTINSYHCNHSISLSFLYYLYFVYHLISTGWRLQRRNVPISDTYRIKRIWIFVKYFINFCCSGHLIWYFYTIFKLRHIGLWEGLINSSAYAFTWPDAYLVTFLTKGPSDASDFFAEIFPAIFFLIEPYINYSQAIFPMREFCISS